MTEWSDEAVDRLLEATARESYSIPELPARYRILRVIGRGGMGVVFEAEDRELDRRVAIKFLSNVFASDQERERFVREARAAARLTHPSIAAVFDAGERYIVMRLVEGEPLSQRPRADVRSAVRWIRDAALAVHASHEKGIVHRDLKPANLLIENDHCVVTDFGLAKDRTANVDLSQTGQVLGTPSYMAPEQAAGRNQRVDATTDVYGLGATLYFALLGRAPFVAAEDEDVFHILRHVVDDDPPGPRSLDPSIPRDLEAIVQRAMEKSQVRRYASALDLADDLTRFLEGEEVVARAPTLPFRLARVVVRHRRWFGVGAVASLLVIVALAYAWSERSQSAASAAALDLSNQVRAILDDARVNLELGEVEERDERLARGLSACDRFLAAHDVAWVHLLRGRILAERGDSSAALHAFRDALRLEPDLGAARLARGAAGFEELSRRIPGKAPERVGELDATERELRDRAIEDLEVALGSTGLSRVEIHLARADLASLRGDRATAHRAYEEVTRIEPTNDQARRGLLALYLVLGRGDDALLLARSGMDVLRGFGPAYEARANLGAEDEIPANLFDATTFELEGSTVRVVRFEAALAARPSDALAHAQRGVVALRRAAEQQDAELAEDAWRQAIFAFDGALILDERLIGAWIDRAVARFELAGVLAELGRTGEATAERRLARDDLESALRIEPGSLPAIHNRRIYIE